MPLPDYAPFVLPVCGVGELRLLKASLPFCRFFQPFRLLEKTFAAFFALWIVVELVVELVETLSRQ
jgi:hypothetical protein